MMDAEAVFDELYRRYGGAVRAFVHRRVPRDSADDVVADVFVTAWRRLGEAPDDALPWLLGIAADMSRTGGAASDVVRRCIGGL